MPFQSEKQRRYLHANHPEIAKRWEEEYATGGISNHFQRRPFKKGSYSRSYNPGAGGVVQHGPVKTKTHHNGGGNGPPSVVHKPKGPTAAEIAAAKAAAAAKKKAEEEAKHKNWLHKKAKEKKKKVSWVEKLNPFPKSLDEFGTEKIYTEAFKAPHAYTHAMTPLPPQLQKPYDYSKGQGNISNIRHAVGTSIAKDAISDFLTQSVPMDKWYSKPVKKVADWTGGIGAWTHGLGQEIKDATSAIKKGHLPTQSVEDVIANTLGLTLDKGTTWSKADEIADYYATSKSPVNEYLQSLSEGQSYGLTQTDLKKQLGYMAEGGIANHFKFKNGGNATKNIKGQPHMLAYITPKEAKTLENLGGQKTMTKEGIPAYPPSDNYGGNWGSSNEDKGEISSDSGWSPGVSSPGTTSTGGNVNTSSGDGGMGAKETYIQTQYTSPEAIAAKNRRDLKDYAENWEKEWGKWDDPIDKYSFTKAGVDKRKNITTQQYLDRKTELEKSIRNNLLVTLGSAFFFGTPVGLKDLVGIDWNDKKFSGVLADAISLSQLEKEYLADLEGYKQNYADLGIPKFHHAVDTPIQTINQEILDITQKPDKEEIKDDGGPTPLVVPKVMEALASSTGQIDMFNAWDRIKRNQAIFAARQSADDTKVGEWVGDQRLLVNSGGLANLFRVKNRN